MAKMGGVNGHKLRRLINSDAALQRLTANCGDLKTSDWYGQEEAVVTLQPFRTDFTRLQTHLVMFATELFLLCPWALVFHEILFEGLFFKKGVCTKALHDARRQLATPAVRPIQDIQAALSGSR